jgi:hypothetical protein
VAVDGVAESRPGIMPAPDVKMIGRGGTVPGTGVLEAGGRWKNGGSGGGTRATCSSLRIAWFGIDCP